MQNQLTELFQKHGIDLADVSYGFHWPPFVSVKHLHMHGIAPVSKMRFFGRIVFKPINIWYCTVSIDIKLHRHPSKLIDVHFLFFRRRIICAQG